MQEVDEESKKVVLMLDDVAENSLIDKEEKKDTKNNDPEKIEIPQEIIDSIANSDDKGDESTVENK